MRIIIFLLSILWSGVSIAQTKKDNSKKLWEQIQKDIKSEAGCTIAVEFVAQEGKVACFVPEITYSKLVCGVANVLDSGDAAKGLAVEGCKASYAISNKYSSCLL